MLHPDAYFARYWEIRTERKVTPARAWRMTETEFFREHKLRRFRNYGSFKNALSLHIKGRYTLEKITLYCAGTDDLADEND